MLVQVVRPPQDPPSVGCNNKTLQSLAVTPNTIPSTLLVSCVLKQWYFFFFASTTSTEEEEDSGKNLK